MLPLVDVFRNREIEFDIQLQQVKTLSPFAENHERKLGDEREEFSASEGFHSRRSEGRRYPDREVGGDSYQSFGIPMFAN